MSKDFRWWFCQETHGNIVEDFAITADVPSVSSIQPV